MASLKPRNLQEYLVELESVLAKSHGGWADDESLLEFRRLCASALRVAGGSGCHEQVGLLAQYAKDLYSDHAHHRWDIGPVFGADILRRKIRMTLSRLSIPQFLTGQPGAFGERFELRPHDRRMHPAVKRPLGEAAIGARKHVFPPQ